MKASLLAALLFVVGISQAQLSGTYYVGTSGTRPGGGDPDYLSLKAAIDALNTNGISGDVTMYFTSDLSEASTCQLGVNTGTYSITFKPHSSVSQVNLTFTKNANLSGNGWYGMWVIGSKDTTALGALTSTDNIIIDGSKTPGGTTRDLYIKTTGNVTSAYPFRIAGRCNNVTIKNCSLICGYAGASSMYALRISGKATATKADSVATNVTIQNNYLQCTGTLSGHGISIDGGAGQTTFSSGVNIRENLIVAATRGIMFNYGGSTNIFNNTFRVRQTNPGLLSYGVFGYIVGGGLATTINIYNNVFDTLLTAQAATAGSWGIAGIYCSSTATWNIYNNMITNFVTTSTADPNLSNIFGIFASAGTVNASFNTILMNQLAYDPTGGMRGQKYAGILVSGGTVTAKNNIIACNQSGDSSYAIYYTGGTLTSDYNDLYQASASGYIGFHTAAARPTLAAWQSVSTQDANSKNVAVTFASATDLHLAGASVSDANLLGVAGLGITTDIDGTVRNVVHPFMGAHEADPALPVEMTSFTAASRGTSIVLSWSTATETNNYGFDVEKLANGAWVKLGFVAGSGTSASPKSYQFVDAAGVGTVSYRLKQIDRDGAYHYSAVVEVTNEAVAQGYQLAQNYPNPFNPSTTIRFAVKQTERATLKVYDVTGREVAELFNDEAQAGRMYSVPFNASGLASGMYIYVLQSPSYREVKRMQLLK